MAFRFPLAQVLKYRESLEQREYLALETIQHQIFETDRRIEKCEARSAAARKRRESDLDRGVSSVHLQAVVELEMACEKQREELQVRLQQLQAQRLQALKAYELARQNREVLDELRKKQFESYHREQAKREQIMLDDLFLSQRKRAH